MLEHVTAEISTYIRQENNNNDSTDGAFELLSGLMESVQEEFEELIGTDSDKRELIGVLSKIFALLLNTNVSIIKKIRRIIKIAIDMPRTKATARNFQQLKGAKENKEDLSK